MKNERQPADRRPSSSDPEEATGWSPRAAARKILAAVEAKLRYRPSAVVRRAMLVVAAVVFVGGGIISLRLLQIDPSGIRWLPLVASGVVGIPLTALGGALEYRAMARSVGKSVGFGRALRVAIVASAANLLPLPGSVVVRIKALTGEGSSLGQSTAITAIIGFTWISVALFTAGGFLLADGPPIVGAVFLGAGAGVASVLVLLRYTSGKDCWTSRILPLVAVESFIVLVAAFRTWLVFLGLGLPGSWSAAFLFPVAGSLTSAIGFFPGGTGMRELLTALLVPLAQVTASVGFVVSALHRVIGASCYAPLAVVLLLAERPDDSSPG